MNYYDEQNIKSADMIGLTCSLCKPVLIILGIVWIGQQITGAAHTSPPLILSPPKAAPILEYEANVSAYCLCPKCCGQYSDGITASGHVIKKGDKFVAAPKEIPFGTMIDIPGYGLVPVLDRGGAIKGNKLDVYMESHQAALNWGRKQLTVKKYLGESK